MMLGAALLGARELLTVAGIVYVARWPIQVLCLGAAIQGMRAGRRRAAALWAAGGVVALVAPYTIALLATPLDTRVRGVVALMLLGVAGLAFRRRLRRRLLVTPDTAGAP